MVSGGCFGSTLSQPGTPPHLSLQLGLQMIPSYFQTSDLPQQTRSPNEPSRLSEGQRPSPRSPAGTPAAEVVWLCEVAAMCLPSSPAHLPTHLLMSHRHLGQDSKIRGLERQGQPKGSGWGDGGMPGGFQPQDCRAGGRVGHRR